MPKHLEHYELTERIKQVNGATWWRGWDSKLERDVAIWTLPITDPRVSHLKANAAQAANLHEPRALRVLDLVADDSLFAVISEWVHGVTVAERVLGRAPLKDAEAIVKAVIECLAQAHSQQIYHGALTADDVVLTNSGIKIRGFGIASVLSEPIGMTTKQADLVAVGATGYAAVAGSWPLLTPCSLPAAPIANGLVALPSQVTPKLSPAWDQLMQQSVPTINPNLDLDLSVIELANVFNSPKRTKFANLPQLDLPPSTISRSGLMGALATIAVLIILGSALVFTSLSAETTTNPLADTQTGTDLRNEVLPVADVFILTQPSPGITELTEVDLAKSFTVTSGQAIQIQLKERRTVQRVELDLNIAGANLVAQVTNESVLEKSETGKLGELLQSPTTAIVFGPRFITGNYVTVWLEVPGGGSVQISRVAAYGTPS